MLNYLRARLAVGLALLFCVGGVSQAQGQAPSPDRTVLRNVNVVTLDERGVLADASLVIRNGRIEAILASNQAAPAGATFIDGANGYLIPGLIDAHVHYQAVNELASYLRYGITTVFSLGTRGSLDPLIEARRRLTDGSLLGAHLYATGPSIANHHRLTEPSEVEPFLDEMQRAGFEFVKVYNEIPQSVFDAVVAGARRRGMGVFGHMPRRFPPAYAIANGLNVLAHMEELFFTVFEGPRDSGLEALQPDWMPDYSRIEPILDLMVANDVAVIPNLVASSVFQNLWEDEERELSLPDGAYIDPDIFAQWRTHNYSRRDRVAQRMVREQIKYPLIRALTYRAQQRGVLLLAGSDAPVPGLYPGRSLHQELRLMAAAGLSYEQALRTATVNGGVAVRRFIDPNACIGVIKEGCEADLVLLRGNPIDDIRNTQEIVGVMADGRWHSREALDRLARP